jgi:hypothetical protein
MTAHVFPEASPEEVAALGGEAPALGLVCKGCGCRDYRVLYTDRRDGYILRRRECRHCGRRVTTREDRL